MTTFQRKNAWNQQGTFDNPDLFWYAKGVGVLQSRALNDQNSWWFFAAIHGEYINDKEFPGWAYIPGPPTVPTTPAPSQAIQDQFWNQCQHQSWYFAPWHRGYLIALEAQIREAIISLGGPSDWALPYWNYFGTDNQYKIPPAFTLENLPDGSPNPLYVDARFGPKNDGHIYVEIPPLSEACQNNTVYTGSNANTPSPGYGGPATGFWHGGGTSGNLEGNPHNLVHTQVGGYINDQLWGLMSDPGLAALDPIFYLHHCNIDRMWAAWNAEGNANPTDQNWLNGPAANGEREFVMPMPADRTWVYTPAEVNSLSQLDYRYDEIKEVSTPKFNALTKRLQKLGVPTADISKEVITDFGGSSELVGASKKPLELAGSGLKASITLDKSSWKSVPQSLLKASARHLPDQVYLQLENVKGTIGANILNVSVNHQHAGYISLFGLRNATLKDGHHGGSGLAFILNITNIIDNLHLEDLLDVDALDVSVLPNYTVADSHKISIGRISIYREQQQR